MENKVNYWMIIAGSGGSMWDIFKKENIACIDFSKDLGNILDYESPEKLGQGVNQNKFIWQYAHDIKINDYIIATSGAKKIFGIGQCTKTYYYDESRADFKHCIGVKWLKTDGGWIYQGKRAPRNTVNWDRIPERISLYHSILDDTYGNKKERLIMNESISGYVEKLEKSRNLILRGAPGTGKTYLAKQIARELTGGNEEQIGFVQFHPSYDYTDFVEGLRPVSNDDGQIGFELQDGIFKQFCEKAKTAQKIGGRDNEAVPNFVFIIDEINRGEISKIFGELFFSIDPGYRGRDGEVSTQYANLHETDEKFYIPKNVYIIGTMNDIDRSVDTFDFAMRRRFRFVEVTAESQLSMLDETLGDGAEEAKARLLRLNQAISEIEGLNSHYHIGPSYFLALKDLDFNYDLLWSDYLQPLLEDYLRGAYDEAEKLAGLKAAYSNESKVEADETD
ncbi:Endonuclease [Streptococcus sp. DD11]|uniref:AAA family ATPase n=1 Tax=Streptococcus sp. DD11 TaxID=1777879 RepID=UPI000797336C|nr:AAA family ATPase [Streptococcus sp. DD11]KXT79771.1 Endonuclease [Streptococcus sp. DD11]